MRERREDREEGERGRFIGAALSPGVCSAAAFIGAESSGHGAARQQLADQRRTTTEVAGLGLCLAAG
jgi:hypothetical protein